MQLMHELCYYIQHNNQHVSAFSPAHNASQPDNVPNRNVVFWMGECGGTSLLCGAS
jgi:hypothetical protein